MASDPSASDLPPSRASSSAAASSASGWSLYLRLLAYVGKKRLAILCSIVGFVVFAATAPAANAWLGWTVDGIEAANYSDVRVLSPLLLVLIVIVRGMASFLGGYSMAYLANYIMHRLRSELMGKLLSLPASYFDRQSSGKLVSKLTYDVTQVAAAATDAVAVMIREGLTVIGLLGFLLYIDWQLTLVFLIVAPVVSAIVTLASRHFRRYSTQMQNSMGEVTQLSNETIKGYRVIRTFNAAGFVGDRLIDASERNRVQNMKMALIRNLSSPIVQLIVGMALAFLVWLTMSPNLFADKSAGQFVAFIGAAAQLDKPIRQLTNINSVIQRGLAAAQSIFTLLDEPAEADEGLHRAERVEGRLTFNKVGFSYPGSSQVLHDISFEVEAGQRIALVGRSGSGKSSLVSMIPRFYDYQQGRIELDGVPLTDYRLSDLRRQVALVSQDVVLFEGTVAENIAYGDPDISMEAIQEASRNAHALEFIEKLEQGFSTQVGDNATLLSGGQRQRLAIARALLKNAPILILDEATSALDTESEQHIQAALGTLMSGRTTFVIAHRLATIESADRILVLEQGRLVESGTHQELLAAAGLYARLHELQFQDGDA